MPIINLEPGGARPPTATEQEYVRAAIGVGLLTRTLGAGAPTPGNPLAQAVGQWLRRDTATPNVFDWYQWNGAAWVFVRRDGTIPANATLPIYRTAAQGAPRGAAASVTWAPSGPNNDIIFTAVAAGSAGNSITFQANEAADLDIFVSDNEIVINFVDGVTTANQVIAAIESSAEASALVTAAVAPGNSGNGVIIAGGAIGPMTGGIDAPVALVPGQFCIVGTVNPVVFQVLNASNLTQWTLVGPAGVIEDPNIVGQYLKLTVNGGGAMSPTTYTPAD